LEGEVYGLKMKNINKLYQRFYHEFSG